jgi:hypothetical protein
MNVWVTRRWPPLFSGLIRLKSPDPAEPVRAANCGRDGVIVALRHGVTSSIASGPARPIGPGIPDPASAC